MIDPVSIAWHPLDEQCLELSWGDWTITKLADGYHLLLPLKRYGPFSTLEAAKQCAEDVRLDVWGE
jgi:hypothetical protein